MTTGLEQSAVRTADFEEAVESLRRAFGDVDLRRAEHGESRFAMRTFRTPGLLSTRWAFTGVTGGSRADDEERPMLLTGAVIGGGARIWSPTTEVDTTRPFLYPDVADSALSAPDFANLGIERAIVDERARAVTGLDSFAVRFTRTSPVDAAMDRVWRDTMAYVERTFDSLVDHPDLSIAQTAVVDLVATMLLRTFPNTTFDAANQRNLTAPRRAAMRRAVRFIDDHLAEPITVADVARAAGLSTRGLFAGFQRDLQVSPMAYLRLARLSAARDELQSSNPDAATVDAVAMRWGFVDTVRFTRRYREAFRETPEETLRR